MPMSHVPQAESAADYTSALERVRKLRQNPLPEHHHRHSIPSGFRLKSALPRVKNLLATIGFGSPAVDSPEVEKKNRLTKLTDGVILALTLCFFFTLITCLFVQLSQSIDPRPAAQTQFEYRTTEYLLTTTEATSTARRALTDAGYDSTDLVLLAPAPPLGSQMSQSDGFVRLDDNNGYLLFQKAIPRYHLVKVRLIHSGRYLHATILDPAQ